MWITYNKNGTPVCSQVGMGFTAAQAAESLGLAPGTWREITEAEAAALQAPTLEEARAAKLAEVMSAYQAAFAPIEAVYPSAEREGWAIQEAEARTLLADPAADPATVAPVLSALVALRARGETPADLAQKVLANAGPWRMVYAWLTGQQQRMYGEVSGLEAVDEIQAYPVEYQLPEGM